MRVPLIGVLLIATVVVGTARGDEPKVELGDDLSIDLGAGVKLDLARISAGHFIMGSPDTEPGREPDETAHEVTISHDFYLGKFPVTRGQFARFVADANYRTEAEKGTSGGSGWDGTKLVQKKEFTWKNPGFAQTDDDPVTLITYDDALAFTRWLAQRTGRAVTLPTEAQFEYAARAGTTTRFSNGADDPTGIGWFKTGKGTQPVGRKAANAFGLFDTSGNVYEWCRDWHAPYTRDAVTDPEQTTPGGDKPRRVLRGGSWLKDAKHLRSAARYRNTPGSRNADNGFRVATDMVAVTPRAAASTPNASTEPRSQTSTPVLVSAKSSSNTGLVVGVIAAPVALISLLVWRSRRRRRVALRPGPDGFWIDAPATLRGQLFHYRYHHNGNLVRGSVTLEPADSGQFVYTGQPPTDVTAEEIVAVASVAPFVETSNVRPYDDSSSSSAFVGYPSAY